MSAESHQKRAPSTSSVDGVRNAPNIVPPQAVSDRSIIDSVAGFINDVALTNTPQSDPKDHILWAKFENLADISDISLGEDWDVEGNLPPPLLLCIGYGSGVQVWAIPANGEAIEVMSWKNGAVKVLRILPTPFLSNNSELASDLLDQFIHKRPLMALCGDGGPVANQTSQGQQSFHAVNFVSLKDGDLVKSIRFKSPIVDIVANRTSIAITFPERIAVFDARTLEDRLTVTTCYPCPGGLCPIALGDRWLAYAEKKLIPSKASAGGCFFDGVPSYTATVLNAAKSLGKGLRELGEQVAAGLTGNANNGAGQTSPSINVNADGSQPGIVTILDIKHQIKDISPTSGTPVAVNGSDPIIAHFLAHTEAVTAMCFDPSGLLLLTADRRGHDFNIFRVQPHPSGSVLAAVHHLYVLHRGDTSAKVQDISFSFDSRWVAVSSLRGTTHVFPITPYGGQPGFRTHSASHVVNRLSRFHRSAGLSADGRSSSPILMAEHAVQTTNANPRLPPFPHPTVVLPLAQLRQPSSLSAASSLTSLSSPPGAQQGSKGHSHNRQRLHSTDDSHSKPLRVAAVFAKARSWLLEPPGLTHETPTRMHRRPVDSLFVIAGHGALIQYDLDPRHASNIPREKVCDESPIELEVEAKAQWILGSRSNSQVELSPPLPYDNWLIKDRVIDNNLNLDTSQMETLKTNERDDRWLSQVEIVTHAGPHRRLWMGPQFIFKTYNTPSGNSLAHIDVESVEIGASRAARSTPMNIHPLQPHTSAATRPLVPVLIESGSCSSYEQSPRLFDSFHYESTDSDVVMGPESQLREDLADAMRDCAANTVGGRDSANDEEMPSTCKITHDSYHSTSSEGTCTLPIAAPHNSQTVVVSIVNPQGTVTTVTNNTIQVEESFSSDDYIHENCDETMFRPVVTVMSDPRMCEEAGREEEQAQPVEMPKQLIVPVIDERILEQKKKQREFEQQEKVRKFNEDKMEKAQKLEEEEKAREIALEEDEKARKKALEEEEKARKKALEKEKIEKAQRLQEEEKARKLQDKKLAREEKAREKAQKLEEEKVEKALKRIKEEKAREQALEEEKLKKALEEAQEKAIEDEKALEDEKLEKALENEMQEKALEQEKLEKASERAKIAKEEEEKKKEELEKAQKKAEAFAAQKKAKKAQKSNKKPSEPEKKAVEKEATPPPMVADAEDDVDWDMKVDEPVKIVEVAKAAEASKEAPKTAEASKKTAEVTKGRSKTPEAPKASEPPKVMSFLQMMKKETSPAAEKLPPPAPIQVVEIEVPAKQEKSPEPSKKWKTAELLKEKSPERKKSPEPSKKEKSPQPLKKEPSPAVEKWPAIAPQLPAPVEPTKLDPAPKKSKKGKKYEAKAKKIDDDFPSLPALEPLEDHRAIDSDAIMKISKHETIGDDEIEIVPHENTMEIRDSPESKFIKNEDFYDIDDDLPPLEPLESFDANFEPLCFDEVALEAPPVDEMKKKMSELLKDTNMIFAMCSSLKEMKDDDESMNSSQIQRSTSSSLTTNTTTATFASASSNQTGEGQDSDYKSLELDLDEIATAEFKVPADVKQVEDAEDVSSFEATSSETDDSSSKPKFKRDDDEELRPLLQTSITSLSSPVTTPTTTTEAEDTSTLPDTNQKSSSSNSSNKEGGNKRKNKKKRR